MTDERERDDLVERLGELPDEAAANRDLWPTISDRIAGHESTSPGDHSGRASRLAGRRRWLRAAAALLIFAAGATGGFAVGREGRGPPRASLDDALALAADVQRTGSEYVAALAALASVVDSLSLDARLQGRDVAVATLFGAANQFAVLADTDRPTRVARDEAAEPERVRF